MSWSSEQLQAIELRGKNLLVAAAAGSGKTSVLVERIIRRLTDQDQPLDVDKLLVVTFTNAAAAEMRGRIGAALHQALKIQPGNHHLERQLILLNSAAISTIHAFCQNIVRQNFHLVDLDPAFRIASQPEINLLKADVLEGLFEDQYLANDEAFLMLAGHYGDDRGDQALYELVLRVYEFSRSHPWPAHWLQSLAGQFDIDVDAEIEQTPWSALIRDKVILELEQAARLAGDLLDRCSQTGAAEVYADVFRADGELALSLLQAANQSWAALGQVLAECQFQKLPNAKQLDESTKKTLQKGRHNIKAKITEIQQLYFERPAADLLEDLRLTAPVVTAVGNLVCQFADAFSKAKASRSLVDFHDLEHFCLRVLLHDDAQPGQVVPSPLAAAYCRKYAEIMVDEYQDINGVQETILKLLANEECPNLFLVGDVKQSIYRFRLAEPELFLDKYRQYPQNQSSCARVDLVRNFRSRPEVLHAVNFLFAQLMTPRVAELEYGSAERLNPGPDYPPCDGRSLAGSAEVWLIDRDGGDDKNHLHEEGEGAGAEHGDVEQPVGFELEARLIVERIKQLMADGYVVFDKQQKQYRSLAWRDIVILLRSVKGKAAIVLETLRQSKIPVYAETDNGYFSETEVRVMLALLSIIDNPRQDIELAAVLRSPIVGLSPEELAQVRLGCLQGDLWNAMIALQAGEPGVLQNKIAKFSNDLSVWRSLSRCKGVPELIWQLYRDTGYYDYVGVLPGGLVRQANLRALYDRARQYETTNFRGLFRFLRFIERLQRKGTDLAVARTLGESEDVVRVMSIHKSKGLEFPVVFVADLGKNINLADSRATVLLHKQLGIGPYVTNSAMRFRYPTLARQAIAHKLTMETKAEEMRILYVALTRAREKLILVGSTSIQHKAAQWRQVTCHNQTALPDWLLAGAKNYLDWIGPALIRHRHGSVLRGDDCGAAPDGLLDDPSAWDIYIRSAVHLADPGSQAAAAPLLAEIQALQSIGGYENNAWVNDRLAWQYDARHITDKPAKLSVSEIKRRFDLLDRDGSHSLLAPAVPFIRPRFVRQTGTLTAAEYGTLLHTVMQHIDLAGALDYDGLQAQVRKLAERELIAADHAGVVDLDSIIGFFMSPLGRRVCQASIVRRELPFSYMMPAGRLYPELASSDERIFVQGIVDLLFDEADGMVLVDYKSDYASASQLAEKYAVQLALYAEAIECILKQPVKEIYLYAFRSAEIVRI